MRVNTYCREVSIQGVMTTADHDSSANLFINGRWQTGRAGTVDNVDPANGATLGQVSLADTAQVQAALDAAQTAFAAWRAAVPTVRSEILKRAAQLLQTRSDALTRALLMETGKTRADAAGEVARAIATLAWNGETAGRVCGTSYPGMTPGSRRDSLPVALGVVVAITPWNFPAVLIARKLGAALAAGCSVVLKASEFAPVTARMMVAALADAGLPGGVVNLLFGEPVALSQQLLASPVVKALSFTGSTAVGKQLAVLAASNLIRPVLELGGHAPVIVWQDADVNKVVAVTAPAKFGSAGQSCVAPSRYLVHESLYDALIRALTAQAKRYRVGHGLDADTTLGAVAHAGRLTALSRLVEDAVAKGARLVTGGQPLARAGFFFAPTVLADVPEHADILIEEPFGPIACVQKFSTLHEAIAMANASPYAFAAYLFTDSLRIRDAVVDGLQASNIGVNQTAASLPDVPLGGLDNSGYGYEGGVAGILAFTQLRLVSQCAP